MQVQMSRPHALAFPLLYSQHHPLPRSRPQVRPLRFAWFVLMAQIPSLWYRPIRQHCPLTSHLHYPMQVQTSRPQALAFPLLYSQHHPLPRSCSLQPPLQPPSLGQQLVQHCLHRPPCQHPHGPRQNDRSPILQQAAQSLCPLTLQREQYQLPHELTHCDRPLILPQVVLNSCL